MPLLDLAAELAQALRDPGVGQILAEHVRPVIRAELAAVAADTMLSARDAARYLYGCEGQEDAFRKLRGRCPDLDQMSCGTGRLRRWKRADLDGFLAANPRAQRRRSQERTPKNAKRPTG